MDSRNKYEVIYFSVSAGKVNKFLSSPTTSLIFSLLRETLENVLRIFMDV